MDADGNDAYVLCEINASSISCGLFLPSAVRVRYHQKLFPGTVQEKPPPVSGEISETRGCETAWLSRFADLVARSAIGSWNESLDYGARNGIRFRVRNICVPKDYNWQRLKRRVTF